MVSFNQAEFGMVLGSVGRVLPGRAGAGPLPAGFRVRAGCEWSAVGTRRECDGWLLE